MIPPNTARFARYARLLPVKGKDIAEALEVAPSRVSEWLAVAAGVELRPRAPGNWPPTDEQVALVRAMLERHVAEAAEALAD